MPNWGYAVLSEEVDIWEAKDDYEDFADQIEATESGTSEANFERYARMNVLAERKGAFLSGESMKNLVTKHEAWIRPARYRKAPEGFEDKLRSQFPSGLHATIISNVCVEGVEEKIEDALSVQWPSPGQGQIRPSMLHDLVPIQQAFNDALNVVREHGDYSISARWVTDTVDSEAIAEQVSAPGVTHMISVPNGASVSDLVFVEPTPTLPPELVANIDRLLTLAQFTTGDLPSLFGEGTPDQETATGQKMLSDQAKGQLSPAWAAVQWLFAGVYDIAVRKVAELEPQETAEGSESFDPAAILEGDFGCYPDTDSSFPETTADKRASLQMIFGELASAGDAGLAIAMQPDNLKLRKQYSGLEDLIIPGAEARDKQLEEIEQLLKEPPVPDPQTGQPTSSVPIGRYDFDQPEFDKCKEWLSSRACREEMRKGNQQGVQNVILHASLHEQRIQQLAQANAPKPEPPRVSLTAEVTDPSAISQLLGEAGVQSSPNDIAASTLPEDQNQAADTQLKAASAQHKAVLAAKEAVAPVKSPNTQAPDVVARESK
jgi:hypothetical protein